MDKKANNWLQAYFQNKVQAGDFMNPYGWMNEESVFSKNEQNKLNALFNRNSNRSHVANIRTITKHEIQQAMNRHDRDEYFQMLVDGFLKRSFMFDPSIDISSILTRWQNGLSWTDAFKNVLGEDMEYELKNPDEPQAEADPNGTVYPAPPLPVTHEVRPSPESETEMSLTLSDPEQHNPYPEHIYDSPLLKNRTEEPALNLNRGLGVEDSPTILAPIDHGLSPKPESHLQNVLKDMMTPCDMPEIEFTPDNEVAPDIRFEQEITEEPKTETQVIVVQPPTVVIQSNRKRRLTSFAKKSKKKSKLTKKQKEEVGRAFEKIQNALDKPSKKESDSKWPDLKGLNDSFDAINSAYAVQSPFGPIVTDFHFPAYPASLLNNQRDATYPYSQSYAKNKTRRRLG